MAEPGRAPTVKDHLVHFYMPLPFILEFLSLSLEPWTSPQVPLKKGLTQKVLDELDAGAEQLKLRHRPCQCFLDFAVDLEKLKVYHDEMEDAGSWVA